MSESNDRLAQLAKLTERQWRIYDFVRLAGAAGVCGSEWAKLRLETFGTPTPTLRVLEKRGLVGHVASPDVQIPTRWYAKDHVPTAAPAAAASGEATPGVADLAVPRELVETTYTPKELAYWRSMKGGGS